jgi:hypothetical protein
MIIEVESPIHEESRHNVVKLRCPSYRQRATLDRVVPHDLSVNAPQQQTRIVLGQRQCPDPECRAHVFFALNKTTDLFSHLIPRSR